MNQLRMKGILDENEAPPGYIAVEKDSLGPFETVGNYCRHCDYRSLCWLEASYQQTEPKP